MPTKTATTYPRESGQRLRELRLSKGSRGWTQTQLSARAGVSIGLISAAERGMYVPGELYQARIARALGVDRREIWPDVLEENAS